MKKVFAIIAIAGIFTSCNNDAENKTTTDSTSVITTDTVTAAPLDTTHVAVDSLNKAVDSVKVDSLKK